MDPRKVPPWTITPGAAFATARVETWAEFSGIVETHFLDWSEFIYRGQRCSSWPLISKFDRELQRGRDLLDRVDPLAGLEGDELALVRQVVESRGKPNLPDRLTLLQEHFSAFRFAAIGRRGFFPKELEPDEWWALAQHLGMATPLLDWTRSAYVACFFALEDGASSTSGYRAVWAFSHFAHLDILINQVENLDKIPGTFPAIELIEAPIDENNRLVSQNGLFTRTADGHDIASFIEQHVNLSGMHPVLYRIEIPDLQRDLFLRHLEMMNIHAGSLFPDLAGAAALANRKLEKKVTGLMMQQTPRFLQHMLADLPVHEGPLATRRK